MKKALALFLGLLTLMGGDLLAQSYENIGETGGETIFIPIIGDVITDLEEEAETPSDQEPVQFIEVNNGQPEVFFEEPTEVSPVVTTTVVKPQESVPSSRTIARNFLYGEKTFSRAYSPVLTHDWYEFTGQVGRSFYSDSERSSRWDAYYGKVALYRYYPSLREPSVQLAGVYERESRLELQ